MRLSSAAFVVSVLAGCVVLGLAGPSPIRVVEYVGIDHREFGRVMGYQTQDLIRHRYDNSKQLAALEEWYLSSAKAAAEVEVYLATQSKYYPQYVEELQGIAEGSGQPFERVVMMNLVEELSYLLPSDLLAKAWPRQDHCFDVMLDDGAGQMLLGHNEDSGVESINNTYLLKADLGDGPFVAYVYAGDLPTGAFGLNSNGIGFTLNYVRPTQSLFGGIGRGFISRSLLDAVSFDDAISKAVIDGQAAGHNVQLVSFKDKKMVDIETAGSNSKTTILQRGQKLYHANMYLHLNVSQPVDPDSVHRMDIANSMPVPHNATGILSILGNPVDNRVPSYPIYQHGGDGLYTLATALFDLHACSVSVVTSNPLTSPIPIAKWTSISC